MNLRLHKHLLILLLAAVVGSSFRRLKIFAVDIKGLNTNRQTDKAGHSLIRYHILLTIVCTFFKENYDEILPWKVPEKGLRFNE
jgi:hypothetical protein